jgi:hypothetical protein
MNNDIKKLPDNKIIKLMQEEDNNQTNIFLN